MKLNKLSDERKLALRPEKAIGNPGPAGWAAIVLHGTKRQEIAGSVPWSTVSEMELRAAVEALRLTPIGARIELRSDSELLIAYSSDVGT